MDLKFVYNVVEKQTYQQEPTLTSGPTTTKVPDKVVTEVVEILKKSFGSLDNITIFVVLKTNTHTYDNHNHHPKIYHQSY